MNESKDTLPGRGAQGANRRRAALCLSLIFILMSVGFLGRGLQQALLPNSAAQAKDLRTNWTETQLVLHRQSPYQDQWAASPYPPWTFPANLAFYSPPWSLAKPWFVLINLVCLLLLAGWAWRVVGGTHGFDAMVAATSITAISSIATGLGLGQNAIIYTALLAGSLVCYQGGRPILSGLLLGIAMSKINIATPFILPFVFRKETKVVAAAAAYMLGATLLVAFWVHSPPWTMMKLWTAAAQRNNGVAYGPASLLTCVGMSPDTAARGCAVVVLSVAVAVLAMLRKLPILTLFGLAAGFGRLWTYHRVYDNVMLAFLLVALADLHFRTKLRSVGLAWLLVGLTLWIPIRSMDVPIVHLIHVLIWIAAMIVLAWGAQRCISHFIPNGNGS
jgi:hypothetical protein